MRPPSREIRTCGVPAIEAVTAHQAASAAARERLSEPREFAIAKPGVSHGDNIDLAVRPVSVATDVDLQFGIRDGAAKQVRIVNERYAVVRPPHRGPNCVMGLTRLQLFEKK